MATRQQVAGFLDAFRESMARAKGLWVPNRGEKRGGLLALGITKAQRDEVVGSLTPEDYCQGPLPDETQTGDVWVFGKHVEGAEVYIKLKLTEDGTPKCISFHPAERRMRYPFRLKGESRR